MRKGFDVSTRPFAAFDRTIKLLAVLSVSVPLLLVLAGPAHAVDGVIEINQARAVAGGVTPGDAPGFPVTISQAGSYILTGNLDDTGANTAQNCGTPDINNIGGPCVIDIDTGFVSLDLNGFTIAANGQGVIWAGDNPSITVMNGAIIGLAFPAIKAGHSSHLERLRILTIQSGPDVVFVSGSCIIRDNIINRPEGAVQVNGDDCIITGNTISAVADSLLVFGRATITDNTLTASRGIGCFGACTIANNTSDSIEAGDGSAIINNTVGRVGLDEAGIACSGACTITGNTVAIPAVGSGIGVMAEDGSLVLGNTVRGFNLGLDLGGLAGYSGNVLTGNTTTVSGGIEIGTNLCGTNTTCP